MRAVLSGQVDCTPCERVTFSARMTATQCDPCPVGTYSNSSGISLCTSCPATRSTAAVGSRNLTDCICGDGKMPDEYACVDCALGGTCVEGGFEAIPAPGF